LSAVIWLEGRGGGRKVNRPDTKHAGCVRAYQKKKKKNIY